MRIWRVPVPRAPVWRALSAVAASGALLVPAATAAGPTVTITPFERTRTIAASADTCPFDIVVHSSGAFREAVYSSGRDVTTVENFHIAWTNPDSGKSITSVLAGPFIAEPNGDGTVTVTINGNNALFTGPGLGFLFGNVGRLVYLAAEGDPTFTPIEILQSTGHQDTSLFPAVCPALA